MLDTACTSPPTEHSGPRLFRTTAFRLSLAYAAVFSLLSASGLIFIHWFTAHHLLQQIDARLQLESSVLVERFRRQALPALLENIRQREDRDGQQRLFFYQLSGPDRIPLTGQPLRPQHFEHLRRQEAISVRLNEVFQIPPDDPRGHAPVRVLLRPLPGGYWLLVGRDLYDESQLLRYSLGVVLGLVALTLLLSLAGSIVLGQRALRRVDAITATANEIMAGDLARRIEAGDEDNEFDQLAHALNAMLDQIEQLMAGMRQVTDNVAHDLRSPLNRLRSRIEVTLLELRHEDEYREVLTLALEDIDGLLKTFNALLSIAQAQAGVRCNDWGQVALGPLMADLDELYEPVAESLGLTWQCQNHLSEANVAGNAQLLAQALSNLLDNAIKYTPSGGTVHLTLLPGPRLCVQDNGPGIPTEAKEKVLRPFVRLDSARALPGNGLGLSLVQAVAQLHHCQLTLSDAQPGLRVCLDFTAVTSAPRRSS